MESEVRVWEYNGRWSYQEIAPLREGVLNDWAGEVFTRGHCHSLALALQELTGGSLVALWSDDAVADHIVVEISDGAYLDIEGLHSEEELLAENDGGMLEYTDIGEIEAWVRRGDYRDIYWEDALPFARALCEREGIEIRELAAA